MPFYEFKCSCGKKFTELLKIEERNNIVKCECGKTGKKIISLPSLTGFDKYGRSN